MILKKPPAAKGLPSARSFYESKSRKAPAGRGSQFLSNEKVAHIAYKLQRVPGTFGGLDFYSQSARTRHIDRVCGAGKLALKVVSLCHSCHFYGAFIAIIGMFRVLRLNGGWGRRRGLGFRLAFRVARLISRFEGRGCGCARAGRLFDRSACGCLCPADAGHDRFGFWRVS